MKPLVSIVLPCYNEENSIDHLLTSLIWQNIHVCAPTPWDPNVNSKEYYCMKDSTFPELAQIWKDYEHALEQEYYL